MIVITNGARERLEMLAKVRFYYNCGCHDSIREMDDLLIEDGYAVLVPADANDPLKDHCPQMIELTAAGYAALGVTK